MDKELTQKWEAEPEQNSGKGRDEQRGNEGRGKGRDEQSSGRERGRDRGPDPRWRWKAKQVLYNYTSNKRLLRDSREEIIYAQGRYTDRRWRRGGISDPTAAKVLLLDDPRRQALAREVAAVDKLRAALSADGRRHRLRCLQLLDLVYLRHSHSLYYAAVELECSERTCKRMNTAILTWIAQELGWLERP